MVFQKQDMAGNHYRWKEDTEGILYSGQPTRRLFDRFNGDQVLFIINLFGSLSDKFTIQDARMIEYQISHHLPLEARSEISVFNWIRDTPRDIPGLTDN